MELNYLQNTVYKTAINAGVNDVPARLIVSQFAHESANFTSPVFIRNNNPMGMKVPSVRKSPYILGAGSKAPSNEGATPYARYASLTDATLDFLHWLKFNHVNPNSLTTPEIYASVLKSKGYYGASISDYTAAMKRFFSRFANATIPTGGSVVVLIIIAATLYFLIH
jgi:Mannosyl-glycoprotein endo-beta-N-acetylglucosaminidase.